MAPVSAPVVRVEALAVGYDDEVLLHDVNFTVSRGEVFMILGGSGSGKSTLLKNMIGLYEPLAGHGFIDDEAPPPDPTTWGATPPLPSALEQAVIARQDGCGFGAMLARLEDDPADNVATVLARWGRLIAAREAQ